MKTFRRHPWQTFYVALLVLLYAVPKQGCCAFLSVTRKYYYAKAAATTLRGGEQSIDELSMDRRQALKSAGAAMLSSSLLGASPSKNGDASFFPFTTRSTPNETKKKARIAVIGAGWWSQGWHLPQLHRNERAEIAAIVQHSEHPSSKLADLKSRAQLSEMYHAPWYEDISEVFQDAENLEPIDGVLVATPHSTHYDIARTLFAEAHRRRRAGENPLNILMEKPMTTDVEEAKEIHDMVTEYREKGGTGCFLVNHSANYREKAKIARQVVADKGQLGRLQHISAFFASPLMEIFDDPEMKGWNEANSDKMIGNGFAWGQIAQMLGYLFHVCPDLDPQSVFCQMSYSDKTGADIAHSATIICRDCREENVIISLSGTALVPGGETQGVGKQARVQIYGHKGALLYAGNDSQEDSGHMEVRLVATGGEIEYPAGDGFYFENTKQDGDGPESLQSFISACLGEDYYDGAGSLLGLKTVQVIHAMYRSSKSSQLEKVQCADAAQRSCIGIA